MKTILMAIAILTLSSNSFADTQIIKNPNGTTTVCTTAGLVTICK